MLPQTQMQAQWPWGTPRDGTTDRLARALINQQLHALSHITHTLTSNPEMYTTIPSLHKLPQYKLMRYIWINPVCYIQQSTQTILIPLSQHYKSMHAHRTWSHCVCHRCKHGLTNPHAWTTPISIINHKNPSPKLLTTSHNHHVYNL